MSSSELSNGNTGSPNLPHPEADPNSPHAGGGPDAASSGNGGTPRYPFSRNQTIAGAAAILVGAALFFHESLIGWSYDALDAVSSKQEGQIIVNSPAVYTRQRLVNDRLSQASWLRTQLDATSKTNTAAFLSVDQVQHTVRATKATVGVGIGTSVAQDDSQQGQTPRGASSGDDPSQVESLNVKPTTLDLFRAMNTYREEIRAEMMQTLLDDRHDIKGNTIYRLGFDATVLAGTKSDDLAIIELTLAHREDEAAWNELYEEWHKYLQRTLQDSIENIAGAFANRKVDARIHLWLSQFLIRGICDQIADKEKRQDCAAADENSDYAKAMQSYATAYVEYQQFVSRQNFIKYAEEELKKIGESHTQYFLLRLYETALNICGGSDGKVRQNFSYKDNPPPAPPTFLSCPRLNLDNEALVGAMMLYETVRGTQSAAQSLKEKNFKADQEYFKKTYCKDPDDTMSCIAPRPTKAQFRCVAADYMRYRLENSDPLMGSPVNPYFDFRVLGREIDSCNLLVSRKEITHSGPPQCLVARELADTGTAVPESLKADCQTVNILKGRVAAGNEVYAYSTVPRTLVQRVSTSADTRDAYQMIAKAKIGAGGKDLEPLLQGMREKSDRLQAVLSHPVVVGFSSGEVSSAPTNTTRFGWIVAPQLGSDQRPKHRDNQYSLAAVISVPTWWRTVTLHVSTCWISRRNLATKVDAANPPQHRLCKESTPRQIDVRLPSDVRELSQKIGFEVIQQPRLYDTGRPPPTLQVGSRGELLLRGGRLWRSTEVTLGQQLADDIVVLPNMEGVVAKFNCVRPQLSVAGQLQPGITETQALVWTSEGVTEAETVYLYTPPHLQQSGRAQPCPDVPGALQPQQALSPQTSPQPQPTGAAEQAVNEVR